MVRKVSQFPTRGELVIGRVSRVNPFSAFVRLDEYPGVEGMIHISEVTRRWVKDIREHVKVGQQVVVKVMRVEEDKGHVGLSLKRVSKNEADGKLKEIKREQRAEKMLGIAAKEMGITLEEAYNEVGFKLQEEFGEMWDAFHKALTPEGKELLAKKGIPEKWVTVIASTAEKSIEIKEVPIKGILELSTSVPDGVGELKKIFKDIQEKGIEVHYISAPNYFISLKTKEAKKGEKKLKQAAEEAIKKISALGGEGKFTRSD